MEITKDLALDKQQDISIITELMDKVIDLYLNSDGVCVSHNSKICDSYTTLIWIKEDECELHIEFDEDELKDIVIKCDEIKEIKFDELSECKISILKLKDGDNVLIFNL